ncbi:hypothetical protein LCGC14_1923310 [marine sediment metagenome]|uniref:Uncharacterized protein n=1 Tax=marine sediment metagenome TaxID=412755 RepID=A0A0F9IMX3_9ZZZZ
MNKQLKYKLFELSHHLYPDHFILINKLTAAVDLLGLRLGTVDLGTEDVGRRVVSVYGLSDHPRYVAVVWITTECGNLEANFELI